MQNKHRGHGLKGRRICAGKLDSELKEQDVRTHSVSASKCKESYVLRVAPVIPVPLSDLFPMYRPFIQSPRTEII